MASRHISNTLSRWHKVVDRIKTATKQLAGNIGGDIGAVSYNSAVIFSAERAGIVKDTDAALAKVPLLMKLNASLGHIRESLATANVEKGVSALLAAQVGKQNEQALYEALIQAAGSARLRLADAEKVLADAAKGETNRHYRESHAFARVDEAQVESWKARVEELGRELTALTDQISDVNASRLAIELDEEVLAHLGA